MSLLAPGGSPSAGQEVAAETMPGSPARERSLALQALLQQLKAERYHFVTVTPATHRRVIRRPGMERAQDLRGVFGWSLPFDPSVLPAGMLDTLQAADLVASSATGLRSRVRVASLEGDLFLHSAFPPAEEDAVFFGPDTYRFATFLRRILQGAPACGILLDIGAGSGAGAKVAACLAAPRRILVSDVNPTALEFAQANLRASGLACEALQASGIEGAPAGVDLMIANPPFIAGDGGRTYRDGGRLHGAALSLDWTRDGVARLPRGGRFVLYTGSAIVDGRDGLREALAETFDRDEIDMSYEELDPDIFGGQLAAPAYADVERIAAVGAVFTRR